MLETNTRQNFKGYKLTFIYTLVQTCNKYDLKTHQVVPRTDCDIMRHRIKGLCVANENLKNLKTSCPPVDLVDSCFQVPPNPCYHSSLHIQWFLSLQPHPLINMHSFSHTHPKNEHEHGRQMAQWHYHHTDMLSPN